MTTPTQESYETIQKAYSFFNTSLFKGDLPTCLITFQRQNRIMGYVSFDRWENKDQVKVDELAINPEYFANYPTIEICQTLCHEMVHIWQAHFGQPGRRGYHNKQWAEKMMRIGLMPSTTNEPGGNTTGEKVGDYIIANGPFLKACQELLKTGFALLWVDRYSVYREETPVIAYTKSGKAVELETLAVNQHRKVKSLPLDQSVPLAIGSEDLGLDLFGQDVQTPLLASTKVSNKSNRHKYQCSNCRILLWGKPGLNVVCGECEIGLTEIT